MFTVIDIVDYLLLMNTSVTRVTATSSPVMKTTAARSSGLIDNSGTGVETTTRMKTETSTYPGGDDVTATYDKSGSSLSTGQFVVYFRVNIN